MARRMTDMNTVITVVLLVISIGLAVAGQLAMKAGMNDVVSVHGDLKMENFKHPVTLVKWLFKDGPWAVGGILLYAISALFWLVVLSRTSLSVAYPMVAAGYVVVVLYSKFVFNENVKWISWVGLAFIVIGVIITAQGLPKKTTESKPVKSTSSVVRAVVETDTSKAIPSYDDAGIDSPD
jgi:drug/metabolite transporter (DMT)-like permease